MFRCAQHDNCAQHDSNAIAVPEQREGYEQIDYFENEFSLGNFQKAGEILNQADIGVFGGSGFYSFLKDIEEYQEITLIQYDGKWVVVEYSWPN